MKYQVVPAVVYRHQNGGTASIYGAVPWRGEAEALQWSREQVGWTVYNPNTGQYGVGRPPFKTREEADKFVEAAGECPRIGIGD